MHPKKSKGRSGFTLLELLIALTLFTVVMVIVGSVFGTGIVAWKRGEEEIGLYQDLRLALDRMAVELRNSLSYENTPFEGQRDLLSFVQLHTSRFSSAPPEWVQVTYEMTTNSGTPSLVRRVSPFSKDKTEEDVLLSNVSEVQFSYPSLEKKGEWEWKEKWDFEKFKGPPPFVKMAFVMTGGERLEKIFWIPTGVQEKETPPPPTEEKKPEGAKKEEGENGGP